MTAVQKARTLGFKASLAHRGFSLKLMPSGPTLQFLQERVLPAPGQFKLDQESRQVCRLHILREHLGGTQITPEMTLKDEASGDTFRVTEIENLPVNIAVVLDCEVRKA